MNTHPTGISNQVPCPFLIPEQNISRCSRGDLFMSLALNVFEICLLKRLQYAQLHFGGCLAGKCNCQDLFRGVNRCQQFEVALDQQFGFSGSGRCLHDKGASDIQGAETR